MCVYVIIYAYIHTYIYIYIYITPSGYPSAYVFGTPSGYPAIGRKPSGALFLTRRSFFIKMVRMGFPCAVLWRPKALDCGMLIPRKYLVVRTLPSLLRPYLVANSNILLRLFPLLFVLLLLLLLLSLLLLLLLVLLVILIRL